MTETASLVIKVDSSGASKATRDLDKLERAALGNEKAASKVGKAWGVAIGLLSSAVIVGATRSFIRQADAFANMSARIGLVTKNGAELVKVQRQLFDLSQATSSDLESTTDLYVKLAQSSDALRNNQALLLRTTELVSKSLVVSGTGAAGAAAAIRQFSQAMGAGALRGDEFISIMENAPRLARAIADGMGVPVGALRELARQGKLTSEEVVKAIESQGDAIDREFGKMPLTVSRATQQVKNALTQMIGETDRAEGASADLAKSIAELARVLESEETKSGFAAMVSGLGDIISFGAQAANTLAGIRQATLDMFSADEQKSYMGLLAKRWALEDKKGEAWWKPGSVNHPLAFGARDDLDQQIADLDRLIAKRREEMQLARNLGTPVNLVTGKADFSGVSGGATGGWELPPVERVETATSAVRELTLAEQENALYQESLARARGEAADQLRESEEAVKRGQAATDLLIGDMQFELDLLGMTNADREKAIALRYADAHATDEQRRAIVDLADKLETARDARRFIDDIRGAATEFASSALSGFGSVGESFERMVDRMKRAAADMLADKAIQWLISALFGQSGTPGGAEAQGGLVDLYSGNGFGFAKGGVPNADLSKYSGSIVDKPTFFANGGNVMGEAGPEGIFPLKRGSDGKLGVVAMGSGGANVNVNVKVVNAPGAKAEATETTGADGSRQIEVLIDGMVGKSIRRGQGAKALEQTFGLRRAGTARGF